jgi:hypothetical protein
MIPGGTWVAEIGIDLQKARPGILSMPYTHLDSPALLHQTRGLKKRTSSFLLLPEGREYQQQDLNNHP